MVMSEQKDIVFTSDDAKKEIERIEDEITSETEKANFHQTEINRIVQGNEEIQEHVRKRDLHSRRLAELTMEKRVFERIFKATEKPKVEKKVKENKPTKRMDDKNEN